MHRENYVADYVSARYAAPSRQQCGRSGLAFVDGLLKCLTHRSVRLVGGASQARFPANSLRLSGNALDDKSLDHCRARFVLHRPPTADQIGTIVFGFLAAHVFMLHITPAADRWRSYSAKSDLCCLFWLHNCAGSGTMYLPPVRKLSHKVFANCSEAGLLRSQRRSSREQPVAGCIRRHRVARMPVTITRG
jgi:hypothetical protein